MSESTINNESTVMTEVVRPQYLNHHGNLFGGYALQMMDTAAFTAATRVARQTMVTVAAENVQFIAPVKHGEIVELVATVVRVGNTSVTVDIEMNSEQLLTGEKCKCGTARFVFVAVDAGGKPVKIAKET